MAVIDTSVLIHLCRVGNLEILKKFFKKIAITQEVYDELQEGKIGFSEVEKGKNEWIRIQNPKEKEKIKQTSKLENIEEADASIILLAKERKDILLSNDYALIRIARSKNIECWWLTTFLLKCLEKNVLTKKDAKELLLELIESGMRLSNVVYAAILKEIETM